MIAALLKSPEIKVGLLVVILAGIIGVMSVKVSQDPSYLGGTKIVWFMMDDASGLVKNSTVKTAGIDVGIIKDVQLENGQAKIIVSVRGDAPLTKSARIEIRPNGILGDKHVEIVAGDPRDPPLKTGDQILVVDDRASMDRLIGEISKITKSLTSVAENIRTATDGDTSKPLGRILANIEKLTGDVSELTSERKGQIGEIIENIHGITSTIDDMVNDESDDGLKSAWKGALHSLKRIDKSLKNVEEITDKINRGEGTIGKLINDDTTIENVNTAVDSINGYLETASKLETSLDYHTDVGINDGQTKSIIALKVQPGLDRYYEVGVVSDSKGYSEKRQMTTSTNGGSDVVVTEKDVYYNRIKFNALFAKNFYNWTLKGGVIENTGGLGLDYHLLRHKLKLSLEAFDFSNFHLRASARYNIYSGIYISAGGDDLLSSKGQNQAFAGAGIFLTNDDLKMLVSKLPF